MGLPYFGNCLDTLISYKQYCSNDIVLKDTKQQQNKPRQLLEQQYNLFPILPTSHSKNSRFFLLQTTMTADIKWFYMPID